eukprot:gene1005-1530_t
MCINLEGLYECQCMTGYAVFQRVDGTSECIPACTPSEVWLRDAFLDTLSVGWTLQQPQACDVQGANTLLTLPGIAAELSFEVLVKKAGHGDTWLVGSNGTAYSAELAGLEAGTEYAIRVLAALPSSDTDSTDSDLESSSDSSSDSNDSDLESSSDSSSDFSDSDLESSSDSSSDSSYPDLHEEGLVYSFKLTVVKGARDSATTTTVAVEQGAPPVLAITPLSGRVNACDKFTVESSVMSSANASTLTVHWSMEGGTGQDGAAEPVDLAAPGVLLSEGTTSLDLVLSAGVLQQGTQYWVRLDAEDANGNGTTSLTFSTNAGPTGGALNVSPMAGIALDTVFTATASGWSDEEDDLPLAYHVAYRVVGVTDTSFQTVYSDSIMASAEMQLPEAGLAETGGSVEVSLVVRDRLGAESARTTVTISVTEQVFNSSAEADEFTGTVVSSSEAQLANGNVDDALTSVSGAMALLEPADARRARRLLSQGADDGAEQRREMRESLVRVVSRAADMQPLTAAFQKRVVVLAARLVSGDQAEVTSAAAQATVQMLARVAERSMVEEGADAMERETMERAVHAASNVSAAMREAGASSQVQEMLVALADAALVALAAGEAPVVAEGARAALRVQRDSHGQAGSTSARLLGPLSLKSASPAAVQLPLEALELACAEAARMCRMGVRLIMLDDDPNPTAAEHQLVRSPAPSPPGSSLAGGGNQTETADLGASSSAGLQHVLLIGVSLSGWEVVEVAALSEPVAANVTLSGGAVAETDSGSEGHLPVRCATWVSAEGAYSTAGCQGLPNPAPANATLFWRDAAETGSEGALSAWGMAHAWLMEGCVQVPADPDPAGPEAATWEFAGETCALVAGNWNATSSASGRCVWDAALGAFVGSGCVISEEVQCRCDHIADLRALSDPWQPAPATMDSVATKVEVLEDLRFGEAALPDGRIEVLVAVVVGLWGASALLAAALGERAAAWGRRVLWRAKALAAAQGMTPLGKVWLWSLSGEDLAAASASHGVSFEEKRDAANTTGARQESDPPASGHEQWTPVPSTAEGVRPSGTPPSSLGSRATALASPPESPPLSPRRGEHEAGVPTSTWMGHEGRHVSQWLDSESRAAALEALAGSPQFAVLDSPRGPPCAEGDLTSGYWQATSPAPVASPSSARLRPESPPPRAPAPPPASARLSDAAEEASSVSRLREVAGGAAAWSLVVQNMAKNNRERRRRSGLYVDEEEEEKEAFTAAGSSSRAGGVEVVAMYRDEMCEAAEEPESPAGIATGWGVQGQGHRSRALSTPHTWWHNKAAGMQGMEGMAEPRDAWKGPEAPSAFLFEPGPDEEPPASLRETSPPPSHLLEPDEINLEPVDSPGESTLTGTGGAEISPAARMMGLVGAQLVSRKLSFSPASSGRRHSAAAAMGLFAAEALRVSTAAQATPRPSPPDTWPEGGAVPPLVTAPQDAASANAARGEDHGECETPPSPMSIKAAAMMQRAQELSQMASGSPTSEEAAAGTSFSDGHPGTSAAKPVTKKTRGQSLMALAAAAQAGSAPEAQASPADLFSEAASLYAQASTLYAQEATTLAAAATEEELGSTAATDTKESSKATKQPPRGRTSWRARVSSLLQSHPLRRDSHTGVAGMPVAADPASPGLPAAELGRSVSALTSGTTAGGAESFTWDDEAQARRPYRQMSMAASGLKGGTGTGPSAGLGAGGGRESFKWDDDDTLQSTAARVQQGHLLPAPHEVQLSPGSSGLGSSGGGRASFKWDDDDTLQSTPARMRQGHLLPAPRQVQLSPGSSGLGSSGGGRASFKWDDDVVSESPSLSGNRPALQKSVSRNSAGSGGGAASDLFYLQEPARGPFSHDSSAKSPSPSSGEALAARRRQSLPAEAVVSRGVTRGTRRLTSFSFSPSDQEGAGGEDAVVTSFTQGMEEVSVKMRQNPLSRTDVPGVSPTPSSVASPRVLESVYQPAFGSVGGRADGSAADPLGNSVGGEPAARERLPSLRKDSFRSAATERLSSHDNPMFRNSPIATTSLEPTSPADVAQETSAPTVSTGRFAAASRHMRRETQRSGRTASGLWAWLKSPFTQRGLWVAPCLATPNPLLGVDGEGGSPHAHHRHPLADSSPPALTRRQSLLQAMQQQHSKPGDLGSSGAVAARSSRDLCALLDIPVARLRMAVPFASLQEMLDVVLRMAAGVPRADEVPPAAEKEAHTHPLGGTLGTALVLAALELRRILTSSQVEAQLQGVAHLRWTCQGGRTVAWYRALFRELLRGSGLNSPGWGVHAATCNVVLLQREQGCWRTSEALANALLAGSPLKAVDEEPPCFQAESLELGTPAVLRELPDEVWVQHSCTAEDAWATLLARVMLEATPAIPIAAGAAVARADAWLKALIGPETFRDVQRTAEACLRSWRADHLARLAAAHQRTRFQYSGGVVTGAMSLVGTCVAGLDGHTIAMLRKNGGYRTSWLQPIHALLLGLIYILTSAALLHLLVDQSQACCAALRRHLTTCTSGNCADLEESVNAYTCEELLASHREDALAGALDFECEAFPKDDSPVSYMLVVAAAAVAALATRRGALGLIQALANGAWLERVRAWFKHRWREQSAIAQAQPAITGVQVVSAGWCWGWCSWRLLVCFALAAGSGGAAWLAVGFGSDLKKLGGASAIDRALGSLGAAVVTDMMVAEPLYIMASAAAMLWWNIAVRSESITLTQWYEQYLTHKFDIPTSLKLMMQEQGTPVMRSPLTKSEYIDTAL